MKEMWAGELKKLGRWQGYTFGIVMPCAQRNLMVGSFQPINENLHHQHHFSPLAHSQPSFLAHS